MDPDNTDRGSVLKVKGVPGSLGLLEFRGENENDDLLVVAESLVVVELLVVVEDVRVT